MYWMKVHISTFVPFFCCTLRRSSIFACDRPVALSHSEIMSIESGSCESMPVMARLGSCQPLYQPNEMAWSVAL